VLKYFEASSIEAEIIRLVPQYDENDPDIERYYTFLAYSKKGVFSDIELSESRKYARLYKIEQRLIDELDTALDRLDYNSLYTRFESAYLTSNCTLSLGDAFLEYLHIYGFPVSILPEELTARILTLKPQLELLEHPPKPRVVLEDDAQRPRLRCLNASFRAPKSKGGVRVFPGSAGRTTGLARTSRPGSPCRRNWETRSIRACWICRTGTKRTICFASRRGTRGCCL
jgi:hypothetical protein